MICLNQLRYLFIGVVLSIFSLPAFSDSYPSRPIHLIVPYQAGGSTDQLARLLQQPLSEALGQPVIVDNKPGAGGTIGVDAVVRSKPDGHTLVFGNAGPNGMISLMREISYDPKEDLTPISTVVIAPLILAVRTDLPVGTMQEFLAYAREQGDKLTFGSVGVGSLTHLAGEYFNHMAGTKMLHVPYNGGAPMMTAFLSGDLDVAFVTGLDGAALEQSGKVRYLAVAAPQASPAFPDLPIIADVVPGYTSSSWFGILGPKGLPDSITNHLNKLINEIVISPKVSQRFIDRKLEPRAGTAQEFRELINDTLTQWEPVVKQAGIAR